MKKKKLYYPKPLKQTARDNIRLDVKQLNKELAEKMFNPYYFTDRNLKVGLKINFDSQHINHAKSKLSITPNYLVLKLDILIKLWTIYLLFMLDQ